MACGQCDFTLTDIRRVSQQWAGCKVDQTFCQVCRWSKWIWWQNCAGTTIQMHAVCPSNKFRHNALLWKSKRGQNKLVPVWKGEPTCRSIKKGEHWIAKHGTPPVLNGKLLAWVTQNNVILSGKWLMSWEYDMNVSVQRNMKASTLSAACTCASPTGNKHRTEKGQNCIYLKWTRSSETVNFIQNALLGRLWVMHTCKDMYTHTPFHRQWQLSPEVAWFDRWCSFDIAAQSQCVSACEPSWSSVYTKRSGCLLPEHVCVCVYVTRRERDDRKTKKRECF